MPVARWFQSTPWKPTAPMISLPSTIAAWNPSFSTICRRVPRMNSRRGVRGIARRLDPWEPFGEMRAIRRDDANELLRIGLLEEPKEAALRKLVSEHRRSLTIRAGG